MNAPDLSAIFANSMLPPQLRAMMSKNPKARTAEESLDMLATIITGFAARGPQGANGLKTNVTRDDKGMTIRIDLP